LEPYPTPEDTGTELSAVDSRPAFISNIHLASFWKRFGSEHVHHSDRKFFFVALWVVQPSIPSNWRHLRRISLFANRP